jgi:hypothetical protein
VINAASVEASALSAWGILPAGRLSKLEFQSKFGPPSRTRLPQFGETVMYGSDIEPTIIVFVEIKGDLVTSVSWQCTP